MSLPTSNSVIVALLIVGANYCLLFDGVHAGKYDVKDGRHNITAGHRRVYPSRPTDMLLFQDFPTMEKSMLRVKSSDICYPPKYDQGGKFTITAFNVTDLVPKGKGGYAFVKEGGINEGKLCLHLKTQRGRPYKFKIEIWGYKI